MTLEHQVCSLALSKKLKTLGVKQKSVFYWISDEFIEEKMDHGHRAIYPKPLPITHVVEGAPIGTARRIIGKPKWSVEQVPKDQNMKNCLWINCSAFTVAELGELLKHSVEMPSFYKGWYFYDKSKKKYALEEKTEANARAKMLIYLLENKLVKL